MENKYFTPSIEDIRVGYECFWIKDHNEGLTESNLIKIVFTPKQLASTLFPAINWEREETDNFRPNLMSYIIPYLTKEQIEAEGWEEIPRELNGLGRYSYLKKGEIFITFQEKINHIEFHNDGDYDTHESFYKGKCPSINEFRFINKLLNI